MATRKTTTVRLKRGPAESKSAGRTSVLTAPNAEERRSAPRLTLPRAEADIVSLGLRVIVLDVGFGGLSIESEQKFRVGEVHQLRDGRPGGNSPVLGARVKHCRKAHTPDEPPRYITGFEFVDKWCPGDRSAVDQFIAQVTSGLSRGTPD